MERRGSEFVNTGTIGGDPPHVYIAFCRRKVIPVFIVWSNVPALMTGPSGTGLALRRVRSARDTAPSPTHVAASTRPVGMTPHATPLA